MRRLKLGDAGLALALAACGGRAEVDPASSSVGSASGSVSAGGSNGSMSAGGSNGSVNAGGLGDSASSGGSYLVVSSGGSSASAGGVVGAGLTPTGGVSGLAGASSAGAASIACAAVPSPTCSPNRVVVVGDTQQTAPAGVWIEPLQIPHFGPMEYSPTEPDPSTWDRSRVPAGACVFRLHGVAPECVAGHAELGGCRSPGDLSPTPIYSAYYEHGLCGQNIAPGCPTADPINLPNALGNWWYAQPDGPDTDVVMCAPLCAGIGPIGDGNQCVMLYQDDEFDR